MKPSIPAKIALTLFLAAVPLSACGGGRQQDSKILDKLNGTDAEQAQARTEANSRSGNVGSGSEGDSAKGGQAESNPKTPMTKELTLINTQGTTVGKATLTQQEDGVKIHLEATQLTPGTHGIHLHEKGACDKPDFKSAGGHWNPENRKHGSGNAEGPHLGDLPNIEADNDGNVSADLMAEHVMLDPKQHNSLFDQDGTSLVIHAGPDDYKTDPSGNSGDRIACGALTQDAK